MIAGRSLSADIESCLRTGGTNSDGSEIADFVLN
jgi:hypothetical protein